MDSCDLLYDKDPNIFLRFFQILIKRLLCWLNITPLIVPIRNRMELHYKEDFKVTNIDSCNDFSDDAVMKGKTAEEIFNEDLEKNNREIEEGDDFQGKRRR